MLVRQPRNLSFAVLKQGKIIFVLKLCWTCTIFYTILYSLLNLYWIFVGTINQAKNILDIWNFKELIYFLFVSSWYSVSFNISWLRCIYWPFALCEIKPQLINVQLWDNRFVTLEWKWHRNAQNGLINFKFS